MSGTIKDRGSVVSDVVVLLLGTKDWLSKVNSQSGMLELGVSGLDAPKRVSKSRKSDKKTGMSSRIWAKTNSLVCLKTIADEPVQQPALPPELYDVLNWDKRDCTGRFITFLVLAPSLKHTEKYVRLGCFDTWGPVDRNFMESLFREPEEDITII